MKSKIIRAMIFNKYNVKISVNHVSRILRDNNITYKKFRKKTSMLSLQNLKNKRRS